MRILIHMKRFNLYLKEQSIDKLEAIAKKTGLSVAELIRRAIDVVYLKGKK